MLPGKASKRTVHDLLHVRAESADPPQVIFFTKTTTTEKSAEIVWDADVASDWPRAVYYTVNGENDIPQAGTIKAEALDGGLSNLCMAEGTRMSAKEMSAKEMPASEMPDEKSDSEMTMPKMTETAPEATPSGSETGEDMPHPDMTQPGTSQTKEMPVSEMADEKSDSGMTIPG